LLKLYILNEELFNLCLLHFHARCLRELNDWNYLTENILEEDNFLLNIENTWKKSIVNSTCHELKWHLENKQNIWPSKLFWKVI